MKIVIDIPKEEYARIMGMDHFKRTYEQDMIYDGTPLPEHHGDLVDKGDILHDLDCDEEMRLGKNVEWVREVVRNAPTIIKASDEIDNMLEKLWNDYDED